jgi:hypothetical protein
LYDEPYLLTLQKQSKPAEYTDEENSKNNDSTCSLVSFNGYGGNRFIASLLISIESKKYYKKSRKNNKSNLDSQKHQSIRVKKEKLYSKSDFILFSCLSEVSMISEKFENGELSFRLTIGNFGYDNSSTDKNNSTKKMVPLKLSKEMPLYLPFEKKKPCLSIQLDNYDTTHILYKMNYVKTKADELVRKKNFIKALINFFVSIETKMCKIFKFYRF